MARKRKRSRKRKSRARGRRNPATIYRVNGRHGSRRGRRRHRRNPDVIGVATGSVKKIASGQTAEFVVAGIGAYAAMGFVEAGLDRLALPPSRAMVFAKKLGAAALTYGAATMITKVKMHRVSAFGAVTLKLGIESLQMFAPALAARIGLAPVVITVPAPVAGASSAPVATMSGFAGNIGGPFINTQLPRRLQGHMAASGLN